MRSAPSGMRKTREMGLSLIMAWAMRSGVLGCTRQRVNVPHKEV